MQLIVKGKNTDGPEAARAYAERKIGRLSRYLSHATEAVVEVSRENTRGSDQRHVVQVTVATPNAILRGEERAADLFTAIDAVANTMKRQAERYKGKLYRLHERRRASPSEAPAEVASPPENDASERVVRVKHFDIKPMAVEEALERMELLGHDFFFFQSADTGQYNVLYRRRDGDYGLIEPEGT